MKKWLLFLIFVLGVGVAFVGAKYFTYESSHTDQRHSSNAASCTVSCCIPENIKLTPLQENQIQKLQEGYCQCRDTLSAQIDKKRLKIADILLKPDADLLAVESLLADIAKLQAELEMQTIRHVLEVKSVLPPEKQPQFIKPIVTEIRRRCFREEN